MALHRIIPFSYFTDKCNTMCLFCSSTNENSHIYSTKNWPNSNMVCLRLQVPGLTSRLSYWIHCVRHLTEYMYAH